MTSLVFSSLGLFASADTAYVLAYSIIMLTTDLHSTQVKVSLVPAASFLIQLNKLLSLLALEADGALCIIWGIMLVWVPF